MGATFNKFIRTVCRIIPDKPYLTLKYRVRMGKWIDWKNPHTFNEKLQWIKLYDRQSRYITMVDKYEAKKYVANIIGDEYIIPTIGVWDSFDDIDFDSLPDRFVLKCTHDSGGLVICKDKKSLDLTAARKKIEKSLRESYYWTGREWPYKGVKPRIIAEQYMTDSHQPDGLIDYKLHCFSGIPKVILVCRDRFGKMTEDFYSDRWEHIPVARSNHPNADKLDSIPDQLEEMLRLAARLSQDTPFLRTDFYTIEGKVFFGELTLFPTSGMEKFVPEEFDHKFGDWISIPTGGVYPN